MLPLTLVAVGASASRNCSLFAILAPPEQGAISLAHLAHFCVRAVLLRQSLYLLAVLNRPPQYVAGMAEPFGHLLLVSRWMPQHSPAARKKPSTSSSKLDAGFNSFWMSGLTRAFSSEERPFVTYSGSKVYNPWVARGHVATPAVGYLGRMPAISAIRLHFTALSASIRVGAPTSCRVGTVSARWALIRCTEGP